MTIFATLTPIDLGTNTRVTVRVCASQDEASTGAAGQTWWPALSSLPIIRTQFFDGDFTSSVEPATASIEIRLDVLIASGLFPGVERYDWAGASCLLQRVSGGSLVDVQSMQVESFASNNMVLGLRLKASGNLYEAEVLRSTYAGTTGAEGGADLKGQLKPWIFGRALNVEPVFIDQIDNVFQVSGYGAVQAISAVYERGASFGASVGDFANYAALVAATIPAGRWGTCLAQGMFRLGAPPAGVITCDVDGDNVGGFLRRTGAILSNVATRIGLVDKVSAASMSALDAAVPRNVNIVIREQISFLELAQRMLAPCNAVASVGSDGRLIASRVIFGSEQFTLDAQGREMPPVLSMERQNTSAPYKRVQMGANRSWRVHSFDEVAFYSELIDRGLYDAATVYREGNIVESADKSRWLYINPTPSSGNAPPTWPASGTSFWASMAPPLFPEAIGVEPGANVTETRIAAGIVGQTQWATWPGLTPTVLEDSLAQARADASASLADLNAIANDGVVTRGEKISVRERRSNIQSEFPIWRDRAVDFGVDAGIRTNYQAAYDALISYLAAINIDANSNSTIVRADFVAGFVNYATWRERVIEAISQIASQRALWAGVSGPGKPEDNADVTSGKVAAGIANQSPWATWPGLTPTVLEQTLATAQADAAQSKIDLENIASDGKLTRGEKIIVRERRTNVQSEFPIWRDRAVDFGVDGGIRTNFQASYDALMTYLSAVGLDNNNTSNIVRADFIAGFVNYATWRERVIEAISQIASQRAVWAGVTGTGRPEDNANVTENRISAGIANQSPWATTIIAIDKIARPGVNVFPYPFAPLWPRNPEQQGWGNAGASSGVTALFTTNGAWSNGNNAYIQQRLNGGADQITYPFYQMPWTEGRQTSVGLNGYAGNATFYPYIEFIAADGSAIIGSAPLLLNNITGRYETNGAISPTGTAFLRVVCSGQYPASASYQDIVWWGIKVEQGPQATGLNEASTVRVDAGYVEYWNGLNVEALRPGEWGANVTESRVASAIANQGTLATRNNINLAADAVGLLPVNLADSGLHNNAITVNLFDGTLNGIGTGGVQVWNDMLVPSINTAGTTAVWDNVTGTGRPENFADVTANRTAAAIANQSAWATYNQLAPGAVVNPNFNLITDPGLRLGGKKWNLPAGWAVSGIPGSDVGYYAANSTNNANMRVGERVHIYPGNPYTFSIENGGAGYTGSAVLQLNWYDGAGNFISQVTAAGTAQNLGYQRQHVTGTAPANSVFAECFITSPGGFTGGQNSFFVAFRPKLEIGSSPTVWREDNTRGALYDTGVDIDALRPAEFGSNVTESRTAAAISGQTAWATLNAATNRISRLQDDGFIQDNTIYRPGVGALNNFWPDEAGANRTQNHAAAAIINQGALATQNQARASQLLVGGFDNIIPDNNYQDRTFWGIQGVGTNLAGFTDLDTNWAQSRAIYFETPQDFDYYSQFFDVEVGATYRVRALVWNNNTGAGWSGAFWPLIHIPQQAWFSLVHGTSVNPDIANAANAVVANGDTWNSPDFYFRVSGNAGRRIQFRFKSNARGSGIILQVQIAKVPQLGRDLMQFGTSNAYATVQIETAQGTAAAIAGQGDLATRNANTLPFGTNEAVNSDFATSLAGWRGNAPVVSRNLGGWFGRRNVAWMHWDTGGAGQTGHFDFAPDALWNGASVDNASRYAMPVLPGERVYARALLGPHRCIGEVWVLGFSRTGTLVHATKTIGGMEGGGQNGENFGSPVEHVTTINHSDVAWAMIMVRMELNGQGNPYLFIAEPAFGKLPANHLVAPAYQPGRADRAADRTVDQPVVSQLNPSTGRTNNRRALSQIMASGVLQLLDVVPLTAETDLNGNSTIIVGAHNVYDDAGVLSYSSATITGLSPSTLYYVYENNPDFVGGARSYVATTNRADITQAGRRFLGWLTTPAIGQPPNGGEPPPGGGEIP